MRTRYLLLLIVLTLPILPVTSHAQEIRGVWRTLDASDEEGKRQGGIVFRADYTGEIISSTVEMSDKNDADLMKYLETVTGGSTNIKFKYTYENSIVSITATHFGNVPVNPGARMIVWKTEISGKNLKLSEQGGTKWILLTKISKMSAPASSGASAKDSQRQASDHSPLCRSSPAAPSCRHPSPDR